MQHAKEVLLSVKTALSAAGATVLAGVSSVIDMIPDDVGKLASAVGVIATVVLVWLQYKNSRREADEHKLRMEQLVLDNAIMRKKLSQ